MVIVSNKSRIDKRRAKQKKIQLGAAALIAVIIAVLALSMGELAPMLIPLLLTGIVLIVPLLRHRPYFECFVTDDQLVHFRFRVQKVHQRMTDPDTDTGPDGQKQIAVHLETIRGYEAHSFFTKEQQLISLLLHTSQGIVRTTPVLIEHLDTKEKNILLSWLDRVVTHNKQRAIAGEEYGGLQQLN